MYVNVVFISTALVIVILIVLYTMYMMSYLLHMYIGCSEKQCT